MTGRIGDLSEDQSKALAAFKSEVPQESVADDATYLRFLRARKFVVVDALRQYNETSEWRRENNIDTILERPQPYEEEVHEMLAACYHGFDKEGRPLYIQLTGTMDIERLVSFPMDDLIQRHAYHNEMQIRRAQENSVKLGREIETISEIHDMTGMGLAHRKSFGLLKRIAHIDQTCYPERLGRLFFVNVPRLFYYLWQIAKVWLDPDTANKFVLLPPNQLHKLKDYIDEDQLPIELGGTCVGCFDYKGKKETSNLIADSEDNTSNDDTVLMNGHNHSDDLGTAV